MKICDECKKELSKTNDTFHPRFVIPSWEYKKKCWMNLEVSLGELCKKCAKKLTKIISEYK